MASCHSKFPVYEVLNSRTIVRVDLGTYIENVNIHKLFMFMKAGDLVNQLTDSGQTLCIVSMVYLKDLIRFW